MNATFLMSEGAAGVEAAEAPDGKAAANAKTGDGDDPSIYQNAVIS